LIKNQRIYDEIRIKLYKELRELLDNTKDLLEGKNMIEYIFWSAVGGAIVGAFIFLLAIGVEAVKILIKERGK